ncbi:TadE/TadG family type IV pilus assembly protein [Sphingobium sp.]|uniref:TadE/TadG family type IV pilus assembly protein n=1 Tax=Sphingobium sp. TaxID=1912891 RepID=UPI002D04BCE3|nr:TadE/TadG family type IV pilus assembly protein [Sphingobium sp.]HUD90802.1 TadE/TadG family type IV pilus assembly protein [Sphingobium sp.]
MGDCGLMGKSNGHQMGFLSRLLRNQAGNTIAIVAAALIPLAGMVGGAVDISRGYLAQVRLQQACDAGVLAGRKVMGSSGVLSAGVTSEVQKYVNFNFPSQYLGTPANITVAPTLGANDTIQLTLSTTVPTAVMGLFGKQNMSVTASCTARNDYSNIDIVLVLDTTGSMACKPERDDSSCGSWINNWLSPKSGKTMTVDSKTVTYVCEETSNGNCTTGTNVSRMQGLRNALDSLQSQMATIETQFNMTEEGKRKRVRWAIIPFSMMVNAGFSRNAAEATLYSRNKSWFNATGIYLKNNTTSTNPTHDDPTWFTNTWDGCVEERKTSNLITANSTYSFPNNLPATAYDMMFDTPATSTDTRWTVSDPARSSGQYACPKYMRELAPLTSSQFDDYFAFNRGFVANGGTYLDIGMLWAARLLSRSGMWSADNPQLYHTFPVNRYVIFMTDGVMDNGDNYSAYPHEPDWKRISSNGNISTAKANHNKRLSIACTAIKNMDVKIYTISFSAGSDLSTDLINCSSSTNSTSPEFAYKADDSDDLNAVFRDIGENIGSLRLSQ